MDTSRIYKLRNLDCAECASKVESAVKGMDGVSNAQVDFIRMRMSVSAQGTKDERFWKQVEKVATDTEDGLELRVMQNGVCPYCNHEHCVCGVIEEKKGFDWELARLVVSALVFLLSFILKKDWIALIAYAISGYEVIWNALRNIVHGKVFDENFLMALASIGAIALKDFREAAAVMLFYQVGEYFQDRAVDKSRRNIADMMDLKSDTARIVDGEIETVIRCEDVEKGQLIKVKAGEKIPLDGIVIDGESYLDTKSITGEPVPRRVTKGDEVVSGCLNTEGILLVKVEKTYQDSTVRQILSLVEDATGKKAKSEEFITRFARWYTPTVVFLALALAIIPSLITGAWSVWVYRALVFLVISCPCALVISVPLSFSSGIGRLAKKGVLVKGSNYLQTLSECTTFVFDKTGTLTEGGFKVREIDAISPYTKEQVLSYAAALEAESTHPIAKAIVEENGFSMKASSIREKSGEGMTGTVEGKECAVGNARLLASLSIPLSGKTEGSGSIVFVAIGGTHAGTIVVSDKIKDDAKASLANLRKLGAKHLVILSGDEKSNAERVASELGIDMVRANLLPTDKVSAFESLQAFGDKVAYVGDGVNDAPVLALSDVGIAMGAMGSDAAIASSDMVIMTDELSHVVDAYRIAKKTARIVTENIVFALTVKVLILLLGALGIAGMWLAVFADVGVAFIAIINALRLMVAR